MKKVKQVGDTGTEAPVVEETPTKTETEPTTVETVATENQTLETKTETGTEDTEVKTEETTETENNDVAYILKRPLLRNNKTYKPGEDDEAELIGLLDEDEITRLLKMGVIEEV